MLIEYGNTVAKRNWELNEKLPAGYCRVYYMICGDVTYQAEDTTEKLLPGMLYVLPSAIPYHVYRSPDEFICTYMHINLLQAQVTGLIQLTPAEDSCLKYYLKTVQTAISEKKTDLLVRLADSFELFIKDSCYYVQSSFMRTTVQNYVMSHIAENIRIEDLSHLFNYHPNYFIRLFRKETGATPHQFILQLRMQYAVFLITRGASNQQICESCGYTDASTFTRAFRLFYGVTPQKYSTRFL